MKNFYVIKTGFEFLDLSIAYGFSWYLEELKREKSKPVILKDHILYYLIESPDFDSNKKEVILSLLPKNTNRLPKIYYSLDLGLATLNEAERKRFLEKINKILKIHIKNFDLIFEKFSNIDISNQVNSVFGDKKENYFTLYGSIDPRGLKGERKVKKTLYYSEGSFYRIPFENLIFSIIGISQFGFGQIKHQKPKEWILILPKPNLEKGIQIKFLEEDIFGVKRKIKIFHPGGVLVTVALNALYLEKEIKSRRHTIGIDTLFFNHLIGTSQKPKVGKEGRFSFDMLNKLSFSLSEEKFNHLIDIWIKLFEISKKKKSFEELGNALSHFLFNPTLSNFERYLKTHLRLYLNSQAKNAPIFKKVELYDQNLIKEISKYVLSN